MTDFSTTELLAPAGGRSQLEAAVRFGADAVYLAADRFGMRQRAEKNWAVADAVRDGLTGLGFTIEDTPQGARVSYDPSEGK